MKSWTRWAAAAAAALLGACGAPGDELVGDWRGVMRCEVTVGSETRTEGFGQTLLAVTRDVHGELVAVVDLQPADLGVCAAPVVVVTDAFARLGPIACGGGVIAAHVTGGTLTLAPSGALDVRFGVFYESAGTSVDAACAIDGAER